ncbi:MAG: hypothetical protein IKQ25_07275 [Lachnospiraceae bacterium]|nr:hypothetical protein [Lachnospiraceae bacterium]
MLKQNGLRKEDGNMQGKDFWIDFVRTFFMVTTLITGLLCIVGSMISPEQTFGYQAFCAPLVYALVGTVPNLVLYSRRELRVKELLVRKALQLLLIEAGVSFVAFYGTEEQWKQPQMVAILLGSVFLVYALATLISWLIDIKSAKALSLELEEFQKRNMELGA